MEPIDKMKEKLAEIEAAAAITYGANDIEPMLVELLTLIRGHPAERAGFEDLFIDLIRRSPDGTVMILEFSMHTLRWEAVRKELESLRTNTEDFNIRRSVDRVLEAFNDDWADADIYEFYSESD